MSAALPADVADEMAALKKEAGRLALRQAAFRCRLRRRRRALLLGEMLFHVSEAGSTCLILQEGEYDHAIDSDMRPGEDDLDDWAKRNGLTLCEVAVRVDGTSNHTVSKDCGVNEVGMRYELSEEQPIPSDTHWMESPEEYADEGERHSGETTYALSQRDHHGLWAYERAWVPAWLITAVGATEKRAATGV